MFTSIPPKAGLNVKPVPGGHPGPKPRPAVDSKPAGIVSLKLLFVRVSPAFGLVIVNVSVAKPFNGTVAESNDFAIVAGNSTGVNVTTPFPL